MVLLYGRAGRLTAKNTGFRPGQPAEAADVMFDDDGGPGCGRGCHLFYGPLLYFVWRNTNEM